MGLQTSEEVDITATGGIPKSLVRFSRFDVVTNETELK